VSVQRPPEWLSVRQAVGRILDSAAPLGDEEVPLLHAVGRILAERIVAPIDQPPWDNSGMDGFAVRSEDIAQASGETPVSLEVIESIPAGGFPTRPVGRGQATKIMTGAPVPDGADSIIRDEHVRQHDDRVEILSNADARRNVRRRAEDLREGTVVLEPGIVLGSAEMGVLATVLRARVRVSRKPHVAILSTGDELADIHERDTVLAGRKIVNSNSYALAAAVTMAGGQPVLLGIAHDTHESLREHLAFAGRSDALITSGGASVGEHDLVKEVLTELGFTLDFWRVRMRPGSPFSFGTLRRIPVFGLPGNPVSALVTFEVLVRPALRRMLGASAVYPPSVRVRAGTAIPRAGRLTHFVRAVFQGTGAGTTAVPTGPQGSGILSSMTAADALLVVPPGTDDVAAGTELAAIPLRAGTGASVTPDFLADVDDASDPEPRTA
jgi:molybdopterin molybdotransferase